MENKKTYEELKVELDKLLKEGKIDKFFYDKEIDKLNEKISQRKETEEDSKRIAKKIRNTNILTLIILLVSAFSLMYLIYGRGVFYTKKYETIRSFDSIPVPKEEKLSKPITKKIIVNGEEYKVKLHYKYTVYGKVVGTLKYNSSTLHGSIVPKDVGLVYGPLAQEEFLKHLKFRTSYTKKSGRVLYHTIRTSEGERILTNMGYGNYICNNHILGADDRVSGLINKIMVGNYVKLEGYLCEVLGAYEENISGRKTKNEYTIIESDYNGRSNNNCETIFVTDVKWLREK